jgi:hypothetical protein
MKPDPEQIDDEAPEWTAQMNDQAVALMDLPLTLQAKLKSPSLTPPSPA